MTPISQTPAVPDTAQRGHGTVGPVVGIPDPVARPPNQRGRKRTVAFHKWLDTCVGLLGLPDDRKQLRKWYDMGHCPLNVYDAFRFRNANNTLHVQPGREAGGL